MNALAQITPATGVPATYVAEHDAIRAFAENEKAQSTRAAYRADFRAFEAWCRERGLCPLPADPQAVARHISTIATDGLSVSSIGRRLAGIAYAHKLAKEAGLDPAEFGGHSLRAGFATSAAEIGASILKIMETTRHKSVDVLAAYVRRGDLFKDHAGAAFL
jgi:site-specific recombinase XerD